MKLLAAPLLLGLGLDEFSMSATSILAQRKLIKSVSKADMEALVEKALDCATSEEVVELVKSTVKCNNKGLEKRSFFLLISNNNSYKKSRYSNNFRKFINIK